MQGVVVSSIGNRTLYYPQIRGLLVDLTVIWSLLKFVVDLHKNVAVLRDFKKQVVYYCASQTAFFSLFRNKGPEPNEMRSWALISKE